MTPHLPEKEQPYYITSVRLCFPSSHKVMPSLNWWTFAFLVVNILALALCIILIYLFTCLVRAQRPE